MINLEMPDDVQSYVRDYQGKMKAVKNLGFYSLQAAIFSLIREHQQFTKMYPNWKSPTDDKKSPED